MYRINEIFYSLQGEGRWAGRAALFIRFAGCNLRCPFCDTDFTASTPYSAEALLRRLQELSPTCRFVVLTGGEPTLQADEALTQLLHQHGYYIAIETNGTHEVPNGIDWVTCSPKDAYVSIAAAQPILRKANEIKWVFDGIHEVPDYAEIDATYRYLQPCDTGNTETNEQTLQSLIRYIKEHPEWQLSLQLHKILRIQ